MTERLTFSQILLLLLYALGMAGGQLLFKSAALRYGASGEIGDRVIALVQNAYFLSAVLLYAGLAVLWVWLLSFTSLSRAYPFVALAFAITPLLGGWMFGEALSFRLIVGLLLILSGLFFIAA